MPGFVADFGMFVLKQGWACLFGALMLAAILVSHAIWQPDWPIQRYDALFAFAIVVQVLFLALHKLKQFNLKRKLSKLLHKLKRVIRRLLSVLKLLTRHLQYVKL